MLKTYLLDNFSKYKKDLYVAIFITALLIYVALLFFRFPTHDETLYFQESVLLSELIKNGVWFGDYGVGVHGFIFKIPVALLFIITGPSMLVATIYNYVLAIITLYFTYKVGSIILKNKDLSILLLIILLFSFEFVRSTPTYLREIPSLLTVILFLYAYLKKYPSWVLGVAMLLILDAKEYMFFIVGLGYVLSESILLIKNGITVKNTLNLIYQFIIVFILPLVYTILMFTTSVIPMNSFLASILGLIDKGFAWNSSQFSTEIGGSNVVNSGDAKSIFQFTFQTGIGFIDKIISIVNTILSYIGKLLYPRSFSIISIPKILLIPAVITGFIYFKQWVLKSDRKVILFTILSVFLMIFLLRNSHGRYLFSIYPIIFIFFILFIQNFNIKKELVFKILIISWFFEFAGLFFETSLVIPKMAISLILLFSLLLSYVLVIKYEKYKQIILTVLVLIISGITISTSLMFSYTQGQIDGYMKFGREFEAPKIAKIFSNYDVVYTNDTSTQNLIDGYMSDTYLSPTWKRKLKSWLPKNSLLKYYGEDIKVVTDVFPIEVYKCENCIYALFLSLTDEEFINQKTLNLLLTDPKLELKDRVELKNKIIYIFKSNESTN